jgi:hypothetical protein
MLLLRRTVACLKTLVSRVHQDGLIGVLTRAVCVANCKDRTGATFTTLVAASLTVDIVVDAEVGALEWVAA